MLRKTNRLLAVAVLLLVGLAAWVPSALAGTGGSSDPSVAPLIVGGRDASEPYPAMASMQIEVPGNPDAHFCNASLVWTRRHVVTNAHCVTNPDGSPMPPMHLRIGSPDRTAGGVVANVTNLAWHEGWDWASTPTRVDDVAVLSLDRLVPFAPIGIPRRLGTDPVTRLLGWGLTAPPGGGAVPVILQELDAYLIDPKYCASAGITEGELCIGNPRLGAGPCFGDSGGPAMQRTRSGRWQLIGGGSRFAGPGCGDGTHVATVYTDYTFYWDWIARKVFTIKPIPRIDPPIAGTGEQTAAARAFTWSRGSSPTAATA